MEYLLSSYQIQANLTFFLKKMEKIIKYYNEISDNFPGGCSEKIPPLLDFKAVVVRKINKKRFLVRYIYCFVLDYKQY
jgi:hypothetical protein